MTCTFRFLFLFVGLAVLWGCTPKSTQTQTKSPTGQNQQLKSVIHKLLQERPIERQYKMALTLQQSRAIECIEPKKSCDEFGKMVNLIIEKTKDHKLTFAEEKELKKQYQQFLKQLGP